MSSLFLPPQLGGGGVPPAPGGGMVPSPLVPSYPPSGTAQPPAVAGYPPQMPPAQQAYLPQTQPTGAANAGGAQSQQVTIPPEVGVSYLINNYW